MSEAINAAAADYGGIVAPPQAPEQAAALSVTI